MVNTKIDADRLLGLLRTLTTSLETHEAVGISAEMSDGLKQTVTAIMAEADSWPVEVKAHTAHITNARNQIAEMLLQIGKWKDHEGPSIEATQARRDLTKAIRSFSSRIVALLSGAADALVEKKPLIYLAPIPKDLLEVLAATGVDKWDRVYVLGCFDYRKTVFTQQSRAFILAKALLLSNIISAGSRVAIIGGGIGGVTAAAALMINGTHVTIYEKSHRLLVLQESNHSRYIHPSLYEWPRAGSIDNNANLPMLRWKAGVASDVSRQILREFRRLYRAFPSLLTTKLVHEVTKIVPIEPAAHARQYKIVANDSPLEGPFDAVILAIGFGIENNSRHGISMPSYWENDTPHSIGRFSKLRPGRLLVSGAGDGGLIDVLRTALIDFNHVDILNIIPGLDSDDVVNSLIEIEELSEKHYTSSPNVAFDFGSLYSAKIGEWANRFSWKRSFERRRAHDQVVTFNYRRPQMFLRDSSIINRILVQILLSIGIVSPILGSIDSSVIMPVDEDRRRRYTVKWSQNSPADTFDRVIIRHGVNGSWFEESFPDLAPGCISMRGRLANLRLHETIRQEHFDFFVK